MADQAQEQRPFRDTWATFIGVLQEANKLVPGCALIGMILTLVVVWVAARSVTMMVGTIVIVVLITATAMYANSRDYGQAALALVAGLLAAFTVDWTGGRFAAFLVAWAVFSLFVLLISSVTLAGKVQEIYVNAATALAADSTGQKLAVKQLETIGKNTAGGRLSPVERADIIRSLVFRKIPLESIPAAVKVIDMVSVVTRVELKDATLFIVDVLKAVEVQSPGQYVSTLDAMMEIIRETAVPPQEFIEAVQHSRSLLLSKRISPMDYFKLVQTCLHNGVAPEDVRDAISEQVEGKSITRTTSPRSHRTQSA